MEKTCNAAFTGFLGQGIPRARVTIWSRDIASRFSVELDRYSSGIRLSISWASPTHHAWWARRIDLVWHKSGGGWSYFNFRWSI